MTTFTISFSPPQIEETAGFLEGLAESAPTLAAMCFIVGSGVFLMNKMFHAWREFEHARDIRMEKRHHDYFGTVESITDTCNDVSRASTEALHENTRALGEVSETNRAVQEALRKR